MLEIDIPGQEKIILKHLVCDVNGTLATDGKLIDGVRQKIENLRRNLNIHLLTADTHGKQAEIDQILNLKATIISPGNEAHQKADFIRKLGSENVVAIGQGANDVEMLKEAKVGICVISPEGTSVESMLSSNLVVADILKGLELLEKPLRIIADLRK